MVLACATDPAPTSTAPSAGRSERQSALAAQDALIDASSFADLPSMRALVDQGVDLNASGSGETYPLFHAVDSGSPAAVELLLDAGARTRFPEFGDGTVLHMAVLGREGPRVTAVLDTLIRRGEQIDAADNGGRTPLHLAALYRRPNWTDSLLRRGANVNAQDAYGATPSDYAALGATLVDDSGDSTSKALLGRAGGVAGSLYIPLDFRGCPARWKKLVKGMWRLEINAAVGANVIPNETLEDFFVEGGGYRLHLDGNTVTLDTHQRLVDVRCES